ncbi:alpha-amylase 3, chloroplastic-like [Abrus precatorius]|uniref:alpha-amylase n=1 Tax=Abrus precatorius TaxID=3816 RepID=A0A8B8M484_ABRPR|nr:alpha-amylase 3, chloroplastic-like [Abrus precatorius]
MSSIALEPLFHLCRRENPIQPSKPIPFRPFFLTCSSSNLTNASFTFHQPSKPLSHALQASVTDTPILHSHHTFFTKTFPINTTQMVEGKIIVRLDHGKDLRDWELTVGCNLPGKWILHWGVTYVDDVGREWDQPPRDMIPPGSIPIKDYAIETPLKKSCLPAEDTIHEVRIDLKHINEISAINFVLKDEETGVWYKHKGRDFKVSLVNCVMADTNTIGPKGGLRLWPGNLGQISKMFIKPKAGLDNRSESRDPKQENNKVGGFYEEVTITKKVLINNSISVSIKKRFESEAVKDLLYFETDLPGDVVLHWGVCRDGSRRWEIPPPPHPPGTMAFKDKALRTQLRPRDSGKGSSALITLGEEFSGFSFVLKQNENTWFKNMGNDFYIPLSSSTSLLNFGYREDQLEGVQREVIEEASQDTSFFAFTDGIFNEIRNMVTENSSEKSQKTKSEKAQQSIFQEIERLAAEAYNIFRSSIRIFSEASTVESEVTLKEIEATIVEPQATTIAVPEAAVESETQTLDPKICSATGTGYEILCQGFNWESHKSGRWYMELKEKASELSSLGFTVVWLPPPTESVSPEGYMPKDLYNLNSRYGSIDELKDLVKRFHEVGIKVLGDAVLNHRCAHYQNQNGIWNKFGGSLNWDDRAVVADDPHFQGRGNKSTGDNFHAAPNIDHSQEFVRKDLQEWLCWLRKEIGYDGWRLDFVRGFWGGYVKDYVEASEPYFAVGEFWDSLSYTDGEMDHNQDAHRQRIVDWISATNGTAGAFDVTTKGILHSALERCEYWRLLDPAGKPPGIVGWWPSRAITFVENHDTGSTQGHWRFPCGKEMQGYAYILTHPGTPSVFLDHILSHHKNDIATLMTLRKRNKIHCRSTVQITKAERDVYGAIIDEKVAMKIGPGYFEPPSGSRKWSLAIEGNDYMIWEAS